MNKKGLSDIVTAILFILLILIAIGIIWSFLRPTVESTSQVQGAQGCLLIRAEPIRCVYSGNESDNIWYASLIVQRGADTNVLSDMELAFENTNRQSIVRSWSSRLIGRDVPQAYETSSAGFALQDFRPTKVSLVPVIETRVCSPLQTVACTRYQYILESGCQDFNRNGFGDGDDYDSFVHCYENQSIGLPCGDGTITADVTNDGGITIDDFTAFVEAFVRGDMGGC